MQIISSILKLVVVLIFLYLPGAIVLHFLHKPKLINEEKTALSFSISIIIISLLTFLRFLFKIESNAIIIYPFFIIIALLTFYIIYKKEPFSMDLLRSLSSKSTDKTALTIFFLYILKLFALESILPIFSGGRWYIDWANHYQTSQVFLNKFGSGAQAVSRTPLYNLVQTFFLSLFGGDFFNFQITNVVLGSFFILALYLVAKKLFNEQTGLIAIIIVLLNPWFLHISWYSWPKMLTVFFILLSVYHYLLFKESRSKTNLVLTAFYAALGYLTHPLAIIYFAAIIIDYLFSCRSEKKLLNFIKLLVYFVTITLPWHFYTVIAFGLKHQLNVFSPFSTYQSEYNANLLSFLVTRIHNAIFSFLPFSLVELIARFFMRGPITFAIILKELVDYYFNPLSGALTLTGCIIILAGVFGQLKKSDYTTRINFSNFFWNASITILIIEIYILFRLTSSDHYMLAATYPRSFFFILNTIFFGFGILFALLSQLLRTGKEAAVNQYNSILSILVFSFLAGLIITPGMNWDGIIHSALPVHAAIIIIYLAHLITKLGLKKRIYVFCGLTIELFIGIWLYFINLINSKIFISDQNLTIKYLLQLSFINDILDINQKIVMIVFGLTLEIVCILILFSYLHKPQLEA
ncbi:ArnT family glycosyltransferase [Candidatus Margulisiibacteriota bacterium]